MLDVRGANKKETTYFYFFSERVNGGQAITHGQELSSCTQAARQAGGQAGNAVTASQTQRQRRIRQKELSLQSGAAAAAGLPAASRKEEQNCRARKEKSAIGKTTLSLPLSSAARSSRSPRS